MRFVDPLDFVRLLYGRDIEVHDNRFLSTSYKNALKRRVRACVDFLVRHIGRDVDEISRPCFGGEFKTIAPTHAGSAFDNVDHAFEFPVMMRSGLRVWMDADSSGPEL
jgi:hypothetical protein